MHSNCIDYLDTIGGSCYTLGQSYTKRALSVHLSGRMASIMRGTSEGYWASDPLRSWPVA